MVKDFSEKRKFVRIDCLVASHSVSIQTDDDKTVSIGLTKNVSAGGVLFRDTQKYEIGQILVLTLHRGILDDLDENIGDVIKTETRALGKIVRMEEIREGEFYEYGVCFIQNDESNLNLFNTFVNLINVLEHKDDHH